MRSLNLRFKWITQAHILSIEDRSTYIRDFKFYSLIFSYLIQSGWYLQGLICRGEGVNPSGASQCDDSSGLGRLCAGPGRVTLAVVSLLPLHFPHMVFSLHVAG